MEPLARVATLDDLDGLAELDRDAYESLAPQRGGPVWALRDARATRGPEAMRALLSRADTVVLAGELLGAVLGYAVARDEPLADGTHLAVVTDLYVEPEARGVGIGAVLMDEILAWAVRRGCRGVDAVALPGDRATKNFFEGAGLVARAILVHRSFLDPADDAG